MKQIVTVGEEGKTKPLSLATGPYEVGGKVIVPMGHPDYQFTDFVEALPIEAETVEEGREILEGSYVFMNNVYQVIRNQPNPDKRLTELTIRCHDETARHDWREFQLLKNAIVGPEWVAIEIYPAEESLVDEDNQFFLWCDDQSQLRVGFRGIRLVSGCEREPESGFAQRPFPEWWKFSEDDIV